MSEIKMTYFPSHGFRGFMLRLVMHLGDIPFTEKIIQVQDWETIKPSKSLNNSLDGLQQKELRPHSLFR